MADPTTKTFRDLVQQGAASVQAGASGLIDFSIGSVARAIIQAVSAVALWLQGLILVVLSKTRLATSEDADADSWVADWGGPFEEGGAASFARQGATASVGALTFSRLSTTGSAVVTIGSTVETADGSQRFLVTLDSDNADYDADLGGYVMGVGDASIDVPAAAVSLGAASNVLAGTVTVITSPIVGVDMVTNGSDFAGGADAETTPAMRVRWRGYLQSLREATPEAVLYYVRALQPGVDAILVEYEEIGGTPRDAFFYVVADDGSGSPSDDFRDAVSSTIDMHRAAGIQYAAYKPMAVTVNLAGAIAQMTDDAVEDDIIEAVETAFATHIAALLIGEDVVFNRLYQIAYDAAFDLGLRKINITLNAGTADVAIEQSEVAKLGTNTVT